MNPLLETKHETYGALGIAGLLAGMLNVQMDQWQFFGLLIAITVLVVFAGIQRLLVKRWKLQYGVNDDSNLETNVPPSPSSDENSFSPSTN